MEQFPDGPTERLGYEPAKPAGGPSRGVTIAVLLAMLAVLISVGAAWLSWRALSIRQEGLGTYAQGLLTE